MTNEEIKERLDRQLKILHQLHELCGTFLSMYSMTAMAAGGDPRAQQAVAQAMQTLIPSLMEIGDSIVEERDAAGIEKLTTPEEAQRNVSMAVLTFDLLPPEMAKVGVEFGVALAVERKEAKERADADADADEMPQDDSWVDKLYSEHNPLTTE